MTTILIAREWDGEITIKLQSDDPGAFKLLIESLKSFVPPHLRRYSPAVRQWHITRAATKSVYRWLQFAEERVSAEVEWSFDEGKKWDEWTPPPRAKQSSPDAYVTLHLLPSAPPELIKAAYRTLAILNHPDHGGDTGAMQRINSAYQALSV
jgi:hypothetical protein